jgi:hypothetical protein
MGKTLKVTRANLSLCEDALRELRSALEDIARMTRRYPVECIFGEFRFVFSSRRDVEDLLEILGSRITEFKAAAQN